VPVFENRVWYCRPNAGGAINGEFQIGGWKTTTPLPIPLYDIATCVANNRLYIFGGRDSGGNPQDAIYFATFNPIDGSLGAWNETSSPMPATLAEHAVVFASGSLYLLGGSHDAAGGSLQNAVYYCMPDAATGDIPLPGGIGAWTLSPTLLLSPVAGHSVVVSSSGIIYVLGGRHTGTAVSNVYHSVFTTPTPTITPTPSTTPIYSRTATLTATTTATPNPAVPNGKILAYPNPAHDQVWFAWSDDQVEHATINIFNISGERIASLQFQQPGKIVSWKTLGMAPGLYFYEVTLTVQGQQSKRRGKLALIR
jgi:hypothetical protein